MRFWWLGALSMLGIVRCSRSEPAPSVRAAAAAPEARPNPAASEGAAPRSPVARARGERSFDATTGLSVRASERIDAQGVAHDWTVVRIDLRKHPLQVRARGEAPFAELRDSPDVLVAVNGGFFDPDLGASGLLMSEGVALARERRGGGSGVLVIARGVARLLERGTPLPPATDFAVQCGPRLIEAGGAIGIHADDGQRAARTAACIRDAGHELDLIVTTSKTQLGRGPGLLQLAQWLAEPLAVGDASGCDAALNLDGGPSTGLVVAHAPELFHEPLGPVPFVLVVPGAALRTE